MNQRFKKLTLEERAGKMLKAILKALESESPEVRHRIMMACGKECANLPCPPKWNVSLDTVHDIASRIKKVNERIDLLNQEVPWCAAWTTLNDEIISDCSECGCLLVQAGLVNVSSVWCDCSLGWINTIFEALFQHPVHVELLSAIGRGDRTCNYRVKLASAPVDISQ